MDIVFHAHHAVISDTMRARATRTVTKVAARLPRVHGAHVRFGEDGRVSRVVIEINAAGRKVVGEGRGASLDAALADAGARLLGRAQRDRRDKNKKHTMRSRRLAGPDAFTDTATA